MLEIRMTINWEDGKLHLENTGYLPKDEFNALREQGFRFIRSEEYFSAAYTPAREKYLREGYKLTEVEDDDSTPRMVDRLEAKSERFEGYSGNAEKRSDAAFNASRNATAGIEFGQPILVGHHSEGAHRRALKRSDNAMRKSVDESKKADYWAGRAQSALARAQRRERPDVIFRRITTLEADERKYERELAVENRSEASRWHWERWLWFVQGRLNFERALFAAVKGDDALVHIETMKAGGAVRYGETWYPIVRVNKKTVTINHWLGIPTFEYLLKRDDLNEYMTPDEWKAANKMRNHVGFVVIK